MPDASANVVDPTLTQRTAGRRVLICAGAGGVGKTTISAALGLGLAAQGQRVVVLTIDPAKRLASALGLEQLSGEPRRVAPELLAEGELEVSGELWVMTLDVKDTFDGLIARLAPQDSARRRILENRIYRELSSAVAGSQELMALMQLYDLELEGGFDAIVLDTPPSRNAIDFLETPERLERFLDSRTLSLFLAPGGLAARLLGRGSALILSVFSRATGVDLIGDLSEFFGSLGGTVDGFRERAKGVGSLLRDPSATTFLIITSPEHEPTREAAFLSEKLSEAGMSQGALIVNRVALVSLYGHAPKDLEELIAPELGERLAKRYASNLADFDVLARRDAQNIAQLSERIGEPHPVLIPHLNQDIRDLAGLIHVTERLLG
jgi:anion-transporting  ArsA/GET3 family ATPase